MMRRSVFLELSEINKNQIAKEQRYLSQIELIQKLNHLNEIEDQVISFMQDHGSSSLAATLYNNCLFYKGFLLQTVNRIQRLVRTNPTASGAYMRLKRIWKNYLYYTVHLVLSVTLQ